MEKNKLLRVTQMDAIHLDKEIYKILSNLTQQCVNHLPPGSTALYEPELHFIVQLLIYNYSILKNDCTFGQKLLAIKYNDVTSTKRIFYLVLSSLTYFKHRLEMIPAFTSLSRLIYQMDVVVKLCNFINLSWFLRTGNKPHLIERILDLEQVYADNGRQRQFGSKYMTRELLWNGLIEILLYILPLINYHKAQRIFRNISPFYKQVDVANSEDAVITLQTLCAHCKKPPILPHNMGCKHIFCYTCLKGNQLADSKYACPICEYNSSIVTCERVNLV